MKTKVKEVVNEPTFKGYGRLIFLVDIKIEDDLTLQNIEEILPWYSEINPKRTVEIINYMKNNPDKRNTGLFFFELVLAGPVPLILLAGSCDGKRHSRDVVRDGRACGNICALSHAHGRNEIGVAADEGGVFDDGAVFFRAVVVDRHGAAAEVDVLSHVAVSHIGQMRDLCTVADVGVLDLHEIAHAHAVSDVRSRADIGEGTDVCVVAHRRIIDLRGVDLRAVSDARILKIAVGADRAVFAD